MHRPRLPPHFHVYVESVRNTGERLLIVRSDRRRVQLTSSLAEEFARLVVPLLDGRTDIEEIHLRAVAEIPVTEVDRLLEALRQQNFLDEGALEVDPDLVATWSFLQDSGVDPGPVLERLANAQVVIADISGAGAVAAKALAAAGIGEIRQWTGEENELENADFVVCALSSRAHKLNRLCHARRIPWTAVSGSGLEGVLGPTVIPGETACYLCYRMRAIACSESPESEFAFERYLESRQDVPSRPDDLMFHSAILGNMAALEAFTFLSGIAPPAARGAIIVMDYATMSTSRHVVLRHPACPVCASSGT